MGIGGDGYGDSLGWLAACGDDDRDIFPATECDERGSDNLAEVAVGNGTLRDEDEASSGVHMLPPLWQLGLANWRGQSTDVLHLRVGVRILEALDAGVKVEVG